jgi:hypothetical protein
LAGPRENNPMLLTWVNRNLTALIRAVDFCELRLRWSVSVCCLSMYCTPSEDRMMHYKGVTNILSRFALLPVQKIPSVC